jgi:hypothetical protein
MNYRAFLPSMLKGYEQIREMANTMAEEGVTYHSIGIPESVIAHYLRAREVGFLPLGQTVELPIAKGQTHPWVVGNPSQVTIQGIQRQITDTRSTREIELLFRHTASEARLSGISVIETLTTVVPALEPKPVTAAILRSNYRLRAVTQGARDINLKSLYIRMPPNPALDFIDLLKVLTDARTVNEV